MKGILMRVGITVRILKIIFGLFLCLILLELGLRLAGSAFLSCQAHRIRSSIQQKGTYRIMCLGESTTTVGGIYSYPSQLQQVLNQRGIGVKFSVINKGVPGINTSGILDSLESNLNAYRPDMVITMMGASDLGAYMPYEGVSGSKAINLLRSLRVYKLIRTLWLRVLTAQSKSFFPKSQLPRIAGDSPAAPRSKEALRLEKAIALDPKNDRAYLELGWVYRDQGRLPEAEGLFKKAIELNPKNYWPYVEQGNLLEAEAAFKKAIALNLKNDWSYIGLGWVYRDQGKLTEAGSAFNKAIELAPGNDRAYFELGCVYRDQGKFTEAEALFKKIVEINPKNYRAYFELGWVYRDQGKFTEAEALLKDGIALNPKNYWLYIGLGWFYRDQGKLSEAQAAFKKAIEVDPQNDRPYLELGRFYRIQGKFAETEALFKKAIELNPKNDMAYFELGWVSRDQGRSSEAEALLKKAVEINPQDDWPYLKLGLIYRDQGKLTEAEASFRKAIEGNSGDDGRYEALKVLYAEMGNSRLSREYNKKANELRSGYYSKATTVNYHKLKAALDKRGVVYVCVQYPLRGLEPLKKIFQGNAEGIIFVDNQKVFQEALNVGGYKEYFTDIFGGDFGHCTPRGNRLLAENIADVILDKVFSAQSAAIPLKTGKSIKR